MILLDSFLYCSNQYLLFLDFFLQFGILLSKSFVTLTHFRDLLCFVTLLFILNLLKILF